MIPALSGPGGIFFGVCLALVLGLLLLELLAMGFGGNPINHLLPDLSLDADADGVPDVLHAHGIGGSALAWLHVGRVPVMILLAIFLCAMGGTGLLLQATIKDLLGFYLPAIIAIAGAFVAALVCTRLFGGIIARVLPSDETTAVSTRQFLGQLAVITQGTASLGNAAEARLVDGHGRAHYLRVEPMNDIRLEEGTEVLLLEQREAVFLVVPATELPAAQIH